MSYRSAPYRPSASLIHELRMIAQSFFAHRTNASIFGNKKSDSFPLLCVMCHRAGRARPQPASFIMDGRSVCQTHLSV